MGRFVVGHKSQVALVDCSRRAGWSLGLGGASRRADGHSSDFLRFSAPAGDRPATTNTMVDGMSTAVLPNGRLVTPAGIEVSVDAPKPYGLALSPDGRTLATVNSGVGPFSITLISQPRVGHAIRHAHRRQCDVHGDRLLARRFALFSSGGENGNLWVGDTARPESSVRSI